MMVIGEAISFSARIVTFCLVTGEGQLLFVIVACDYKELGVFPRHY